MPSVVLAVSAKANKHNAARHRRLGTIGSYGRIVRDGSASMHRAASLWRVDWEFKQGRFRRNVRFFARIPNFRYRCDGCGEAMIPSSILEALRLHGGNLGGSYTGEFHPPTSATS